MSMRTEAVKFYSHRVDIDIMKKLALILIYSVASMALSAEEYTIQTISALKESSITPAFEKKIKKTGLHYIKKTEGDRHVVLLGSYQKRAEAKADIKKVKKAVVHDAFIRPMDRTMQGTSTVAIKENTNHAEPIKGSNPEKGKQETHAIEIVAAASHDALSAAASAPVAEKKEVITVAEATVTPQLPKCNSNNAVMVYDRNAIRKSDLAEAMEYYRNSPYHTFQPVALQR